MLESSTIDNKDFQSYFDKEAENVDANIFEIEENITEVKVINVEDFKNLAKKVGLLKDKERQPKLSKEEIIMNSFEVVDE